MQPDDTASRKYHCAICNALTGRRIGSGKIPVCDRHFIEGWGRLPSMPLPGQEPDEPAPLYVSGKPPKKKNPRR